MNDGCVESSVSIERRELIVWCDDAEAAAPLVDGLSQRFDIDVQYSLPAVEARLAEMPSGKILLLYLAPVETLCRAMFANIPPSTALAEWKTRTSEILELNRRDRRRVRMLDIGVGRANPEKFQKYFQLPESEMTGLPPHDEILALMAHRILADDLQARHLKNELDASSLDYTKGMEPQRVNPDAAFRAHRDLQQAAQEVELLQARNAEAQREVERLAKRQHTLEAALESVEKEHLEAMAAAEEAMAAAEKGRSEALENAKTEHEALENARTEHSEAMDAAKRSQEEMLRQNEQLEQRLAQISQGMESYETQVKNLAAEREKLLKRLAEKERSVAAAGEMIQDMDLLLEQIRFDREKAEARNAEIRNILNSRSFRLTAPLRRLRSFLSHKRTT